MTITHDPRDPRLLAAVQMLERTGAEGVQIRYSDDPSPVVWMAVAFYVLDEGRYYEAAGAMHPLTAVLRLCETMIDGGHCVHCERPTGFSEDLDVLPLDDLVCWYQWDPELATFRRGCEGDIG